MKKHKSQKRSSMRKIVSTVYFFLLMTASAAADGAGAPGNENIGPLSEFELGKYQYCGTDADCIKAMNGCCDCANGGQDVAVNRERYNDFRARFDCLNINCTERARIPSCGSGVVSCVKHTCQYFESEKLAE